MAKLVCEDCGEVLERDLTEEDAQEAQERLDAEDHTHDDDGSGESGDGSGSGLSDRNEVEEIEDELEEDFEDKMEELDNNEGVEDTTDDVSDYADAADVEDLDLQVEVGTGNVDPGPRWESCKNDAQNPARIFKDKLRQKRKNETHRERRSGTFDSNRMMQADRGNPRVFKRDEESDEGEYEAYFVLDRSYSMKGSEMIPAEKATATLMIALEEAGVKTELVDFYGDMPRVIKTKSQEVVRDNGKILDGGSAAGNTPLGAVMQLVSERLEGSRDKPFVVVVTDGQPNSEDSYLDAVSELAAEDVPVLGVTIGAGSSIDQQTKDRLFSHHVTAEDNSMLTTKLEDLARGVMF